MNLSAINSKTGKVVLSHSGNVSETMFKHMLHTSFPDEDMNNIVLVSDGTIIGKEKIGLGSFSTSNKKSVIIKGSVFDAGGYASLNREIAFRLLNRGFAVKLDVLKTAPQVDPITTAMINALASVKLPNESECPFVVGFTPMPIQHRKGKVIFFTMMESSGGIHSEFIDRCNRYASEIWVPCKFYFDAFKKAGLVKPMYLMPLGVNEKIFTPEAKEPQLTYDNILTGEKVHALPNSFRFISLFGWSYRKGPDVLCRSFINEFSSKDDACLVIYSRFLCSDAEEQKEYVRNEIRNYYKEIGKENPPPIYYCGNVIPISDLPGCYAAADCFVFCSRGEGFALPLVESGACGIPVISTNNTAMQQYLDENVAFLVETDELATANDKLTFITEFYRDQLFPVLGEKAIAEFQKHMRTVYSTNEGKEKAIKFRERVLKEYTWETCVDRVAERLENIIRK